MSKALENLKEEVKKRVRKPKKEAVSEETVPQPREKTMTHEGGTINNHYLIT